MLEIERQKTINEFHKLFYPACYTTHYKGIPTIKNPFDLWVYQEIIHDTKPSVIIETGTYCGGTTLFLHDMTKELRTLIFTIDIDNSQISPAIQNRNNIRAYKGSSIDPEVVNRIKKYITLTDRVMVILDSDHSSEYVLAELEIYGQMVTPGQYLIVEDSNIAGNPIEGYPGDPMPAIRRYLDKHSNEFEVDNSREKYLISCNPNGYLRKLSQ